MTTIKISKSGKYYLFHQGARITEDQSNIIKISESHYAFYNLEEGKNKWDFYNTQTQSIDFTISDKQANKLNIEKEVFWINLNSSFVFFDKKTLNKVFSINEIEDFYNFHYIGNGFSIYENEIYKESKPIGAINSFPVLYQNDEKKYKIIKIEDISLFFIDEENFSLNNQIFTIFEISIPEKIDELYVVSKNLENKSVFFFNAGDLFIVISNNEIIYKGKIDLENGNKIFDIANSEMINFSNGNDKYVITNNNLLNGPFEINDFEYNRFFKCKSYTLYYKDKFIIKYNHSDHKLSIQDSPFEFNLHLNVKTDVLFKNGNEYAKLSAGDEEYFYNEKINNFNKLEKSIDLIPYIFVDKIYFLDYDLTEKNIKPEFDIRDLVISDYTYYKHNLYLILRDEEILEPNGKYIVYDVFNNTIIKTFESFIEFSSHKGFLLSDLKYHASSFIYTLDEKGKKIVKLPFKTRGISIIEESLKFRDMSYQTLTLEIDEPIYLIEK